MAKSLFAHFAKKLAFEEANKNNEYFYSIVFIKETQEIWTHGQYYAIPDSYKNRIEALENQFVYLSGSTTEINAKVDAFYQEWLKSLENASEGLELRVPWTDGNKNRIALPFVENANTEAGGGEAGQIIGIPNPNAASISGVAPNGNAVLVTLNKWNVQEFGSGRYPTNINGSGDRPTYNDNKELAILVGDVYTDEHKNRIMLKYATDAGSRAGEGAGQIIAQANPELVEGGKLWSDSWKTQETTEAYKSKYPGAASPNVYKPNASVVVLAQMSRYNVQEFGSTSYPINLQGSKVRPTYNDNDEIALMKDVNSAIAGATEFFDGAKYEEVEGRKVINFYNKDVVKATIDASDFIKDGMVSNVEVKDGNLEITFNTDSEKETIVIPISKIFNAENYYTKSEIDDLLSKLTGSDIVLGDNIDYGSKKETGLYTEPTSGDTLDEAVSSLGIGIRSMKEYVDTLLTWDEND